VTVSQQPSSPAQLCQVVGGSGAVGSGNITTVVVNCSTNQYTVGGIVAGVAAPLVLQNNGADILTINSSGSVSTFAFPNPVLSGANYAVTVLSNPAFPNQTCTVTNGAGVMGNASVTN
jgi:hypothetical protein